MKRPCPLCWKEGTAPMLRVKLIYLAALIGLGVFVIAFRGPFAVLLFLAFLVLPLFLKAAVLLMRRGLSVTLSTEFTDEAAKREVRYQITAKNRSHLPITACRVTLGCKNRIYGAKESQIVCFSVPARGRRLVRGTISSEHYGSFLLSASRIRVYDWLWLFQSKGKEPEPVSFLLWPPAQEISAQPVIHSVSSSDVQRYSTERKGDDPSELFGVRGYQDGDRPQWIHWKLSSKAEDLVVKEFSLPIANSVTLVVELTWDGNAALLDGLLELVNTLSMQLLDQQIAHRVCWYRQKEGQDVFFDVFNAQEQSFMMSELLQSEIPEEGKERTCLSLLHCEEILQGRLVYLTTRPDACQHPALHRRPDPVTVFEVTDQEGSAALLEPDLRRIPVAAKHVPESLAGVEW